MHNAIMPSEWTLAATSDSSIHSPTRANALDAARLMKKKLSFYISTKLDLGLRRQSQRRRCNDNDNDVARPEETFQVEIDRRLIDYSCSRCLVQR